VRWNFTLQVPAAGHVPILVLLLHSMEIRWIRITVRRHMGEGEVCRSGGSLRYSGKQSNESSRWGLLFALIARARRYGTIADCGDQTEWVHVVSERPKVD